MSELLKAIVAVLLIFGLVKLIIALLWWGF